MEFTQEQLEALANFKESTVKDAFAVMSKHKGHIRDPFIYCLTVCRKIRAIQPIL